MSGGERLFALAWAPDGQHLAFVRRTAAADGPRVAVETLALADGRRGEVASGVRLLQEDDTAGLAWPARGEVLYAQAELLPQAGASLWAVPLDGGSDIWLLEAG